MAVKTWNYEANLAANTEQGPSEVIWGAQGSPNGWVADFIQDPRLGLHVFDHFDETGSPGLYPTASSLFTGSLGRWGALGPIGGGFTDGVIVGGGLTLSPGSLAVSSTNQTATVLFTQTGAFQITAASAASGLQGRMAFEARVMLSSITTAKRDAFVGLCDQTPLSTAALQCLLPFTVVSGGTSNALTSTRNLIGFYSPSSGTSEWGFVFQLASTAPVFCSNLQSLVSKVTGTAIAAGTFYKLGFVYDPVTSPPSIIGTASDGQTVGNTAKAMIRVYVNGQQAAAFLTQANNILTASFPTGIMGPIAAIVPSSSGANSGTTQAGQLTIDFMRVAQNMFT